MTKIVYNACYGGFGLSEEVMDRYNKLTGKNISLYDDVGRADPILIQVIEEIGLEKASYHHAKLAIRELKPGTLYHIIEYDGWEAVVTQDEYEWNVA